MYSFLLNPFSKKRKKNVVWSQKAHIPAISPNDIPVLQLKIQSRKSLRCGIYNSFLRIQIRYAIQIYILEKEVLFFYIRILVIWNNQVLNCIHKTEMTFISNLKRINGKWYGNNQKPKKYFYFGMYCMSKAAFIILVMFLLHCH